MSVELAHDEAGAGIPLVLLHGFPLSRVMFSGQRAGLADRARVIVPDLRGFGASPGPGESEPSIDAMADDVAALLDRLGVEKSVLGGLSMGGYVAMAMLRRHRERVDAVVLMDTKASADGDEARANRERVARAVLDDGSAALHPMLETLLGEKTRRNRPDTVEQVASWLDAARPEGVAWASRAMAARPESFDTLRSSGVPGFVVVGEQDTISPHEDAIAMAEAFTPQAPVYVIPGSGHLSAVENPDGVTGALRDVLRHIQRS
ncbi:MAG TPA: alpha/beta hydrolase [Jiangellaceae bacterium]|nr:alpha/beta hydrolase [Jiangellaceae bacterium]